MIKILGIDPGSRFLGLGLISIDNGKITYQSSKTIRTSHCKEFLDKVFFIGNEVKDFLLSNNPDIVSIENLIYSKNPSSLFKLAQVRGAILNVVLNYINSKNIYEYEPNKIKLAITRYGFSDKAAVKGFILKILNIKKEISDDESDALAIALTCYLNLGFSSLEIQDQNAKSTKLKFLNTKKKKNKISFYLK